MSQEDQEQDSQVIRRSDLVELGKSFADALQPLGALVSHMQESNIRYSNSENSLRAVGHWLKVAVALLCLLLMLQVFFALLMLQGVNNQTIAIDKQAAIEQLQTATTAELNRLKASTTVTAEKVTKAEERADSQASLSLVPELDPVKARRSPVKLRITPPVTAAVDPEPVASAKPEPAHPAPKPVEIPLSAGSL